MEVDINDLVSIGVIQDQPGYEIPPEGWTLGQNVRYFAGGVEQLPGWSPTLGTNPRVSVSPPAAPVLSSVAGGALAATTYFVKITYLNPEGETIASAESSLAVAANNLLVVTSPPASLNAAAWNVYISTTTGTETKQNSSSIPLGTNFTEPASGLVAGAAPPTTNTATNTPVFLLYVSAASQSWWLWASNSNIFVFDGVNDNNITRQTGGADVQYAGAGAQAWNGTVFQGIPIINSGANTPQFWASYSAAQKMQNLTNWPANMTTVVLRSFGNYLLALNNTPSGGPNLPHQVRWSNAAVPGTIPSTWDFTDPTQDAGQTDLPDVDSGRILDGQELQGQFFIYKEASIWRVQFIGSPFVFSFHSFVETAGILATRCVATTGDGLRHAVVTQDDMIVHNGIAAESLLSKRMRRYLFNRIDQTNYTNSFCFSNSIFDEIWFCYPQIGSIAADSALIWNYRYNTFSEATGIDFCCAVIGNVTSTGPTWAAQTLQWNQDSAQWAATKRRRVVIVNSNTRKFNLFDDGKTITRDGAAFTATVQRTGLAVTGQKRNGEWIADVRNQKMVQTLWPKVRAPSPGILTRVGYAQTLNGSIVWNPYQQFDPNFSSFAEGCEGQGRLISVEFRGQNGFRLDGYKMELTPLGAF